MSADTTLQGVLCMNKPAEFTSFDVIGKLRGILHMRRLGHTGTLDPMATGVLPVLVGRATRACDILPDQDKSYRASVQFGWETDTEDVWGTRTAVYSDMHVTKEKLEKAYEFMKQFVIGGINLLEKFMEWIGEKVKDVGRGR